MYRLFRIQLIILTAFIFFFTTYAYASSDTNFSPRGEGANSISGWDVSNVSYRLAENSSGINAVEFDLDQPAGMVKVSVNSSNAGFFNCINTNETHWVCNINGESVANADTLRVIASDT